MSASSRFPYRKLYIQLVLDTHFLDVIFEHSDLATSACLYDQVNHLTLGVRSKLRMLGGQHPLGCSSVYFLMVSRHPGTNDQEREFDHGL